MRLELEEEKAKTFMLEQQIKIFSEEVMKSKPGIRQALPTKNTEISENNGLQTKDVNSSVLTTHLASQLKHNSVQSLLNYEHVNMQIPMTVDTFNQQLKDYKMKHENQRLSHTSKLMILKFYGHGCRDFLVGSLHNYWNNISPSQR